MGVVDNILGTNIFGANSTDKAISAQAGATAEANATAGRALIDQKKDLMPWRQAGMDALSGMQNPNFQKNFSLDQFKQDPGYNFQLSEGNKAINAAAAARGMGN